MTRSERQNIGIQKWQQSGCKGSLCYATGTGKTRTAINAISRFLQKNPQKIVTVIVPTQVLKDQWIKELSNNGIYFNIEVLVINSAIKHKFLCDFLVLDEVHRYPADSFSKVFNCCNPSLILGLTATYERLDGKEKEVLDKRCPVCDVITIEEATNNGWLSPYKEYKVLLDVDLTEYEEANINFMNHFAFFDFDWNIAMKAVTNFWFQQELAKNKNCELKEVKARAYSWNRSLQKRKEFIANHPKKLEIAELILKARPNSKAITFNSSIKQCEKYSEGFIVHSGKTKKKNKLTLEEFSLLDKGVIHSSKMLDEGLDVKGLNLAIITGFNSSKTSKTQRIGRTIRFEEGKTAEVFTLILRNTVEEKWFSKSTESLNYIELNEEELIKLLNNEELTNKKEIKQEKQNYLFTF